MPPHALFSLPFGLGRRTGNEVDLTAIQLFFPGLETPDQVDRVEPQPTFAVGKIVAAPLGVRLENLPIRPAWRFFVHRRRGFVHQPPAADPRREMPCEVATVDPNVKSAGSMR